MSRVLHYDCTAGISGDMNLSVLLDLGVPESCLREGLDLLGLDEFHLIVERASKRGLFGTKVSVHTHSRHGHHGDEHAHSHGHHAHAHDHEHRSFSDIRTMIEASGLSPFVKEKSLAIFRKLAEAEGLVHGRPVDEVHFHEVGAVDSIVDIVGSAICLEYLRVDRVTSGPVELGSGTVRCAHGVLPVPAPATALLMRNLPSSLGGTDHEATTPTGAAFICTVADEFCPQLSGRCLAVGMGIGQRDSERLPNVLRATLWETASRPDLTETMVEMAANVDDMTAERIAALTGYLFEAGAVDVWQEPVYMKKNRLGTKVCLLTAPDRAESVRQAYFLHSTTLGIREILVQRHLLSREEEVRETPWGPVRVKFAESEPGVRIREKIEYEDLSRIAREQGMTLLEVEEVCRHGKRN